MRFLPLFLLTLPTVLSQSSSLDPSASFGVTLQIESSAFDELRFKLAVAYALNTPPINVQLALVQPVKESGFTLVMAQFGNTAGEGTGVLGLIVRLQTAVDDGSFNNALQSEGLGGIVQGSFFLNRGRIPMALTPPIQVVRLPSTPAPTPQGAPSVITPLTTATTSSGPSATPPSPTTPPPDDDDDTAKLWGTVIAIAILLVCVVLAACLYFYCKAYGDEYFDCTGGGDRYPLHPHYSPGSRGASPIPKASPPVVLPQQQQQQAVFGSSDNPTLQLLAGNRLQQGFSSSGTSGSGGSNLYYYSSGSAQQQPHQAMLRQVAYTTAQQGVPHHHQQQQQQQHNIQQPVVVNSATIPYIATTTHQHNPLQANFVTPEEANYYSASGAINFVSTPTEQYQYGYPSNVHPATTNRVAGGAAAVAMVNNVPYYGNNIYIDDGHSPNSAASPLYANHIEYGQMPSSPQNYFTATSPYQPYVTHSKIAITTATYAPNPPIIVGPGLGKKEPVILTPIIEECVYVDNPNPPPLVPPLLDCDRYPLPMNARIVEIEGLDETMSSASSTYTSASQAQSKTGEEPTKFAEEEAAPLKVEGTAAKREKQNQHITFQENKDDKDATEATKDTSSTATSTTYSSSRSGLVYY